ncbi:MAG: tetratricopeptide repeat protein [Acidobacteria bacterium]|nr:tetratricopeptide repeat protein [Acidobacteriota bacterium]
MMKPLLVLSLLLLAPAVPRPDAAAAQDSGRPQLIRDTAVAEGEEETAAEEPLPEPDPARAEESVDIGDYYFKRKNYPAAIERYLEALRYQPDSVPAWEALSKAYEKSGQRSLAIDALKTLIEQNPDSPGVPEYRRKMERLEKP